jgi:hypothetical protein
MHSVFPLSSLNPFLSPSPVQQLLAPDNLPFILKKDSYPREKIGKIIPLTTEMFTKKEKAVLRKDTYLERSIW